MFAADAELQVCLGCAPAFGGEPDQLADMMLLLASPRGRTISGQALSIDSDLQALV